MIDFKNLEPLISEINCGENIKVFGFDKIQIKRKDRSVIDICSPFRTKEEYKCLVKEIVSQVKKEFGLSVSKNDPIITFVDKNKSIKVAIVSNFVNQNNEYMIHIRKLYPLLK